MSILRAAQDDDFDFFYHIKCDEDNMYWCGHANPPLKENLSEFWDEFVRSVGGGEENKCNTSRTIYIISDGVNSLGYLYIDEAEERVYIISVAVLSEFSGKGYATAAVNEAVELLRKKDCKSIYALIREDNLKSQRVFQKCGFVQTGDFRETALETQKEPIKMLKYIYRWISR